MDGCACFDNEMTLSTIPLKNWRMVLSVGKKKVGSNVVSFQFAFVFAGWFWMYYSGLHIPTSIWWLFAYIAVMLSYHSTVQILWVVQAFMHGCVAVGGAQNMTRNRVKMEKLNTFRALACRLVNNYFVSAIFSFQTL